MKKILLITLFACLSLQGCSDLDSVLDPLKDSESKSLDALKDTASESDTKGTTTTSSSSSKGTTITSTPVSLGSTTVISSSGDRTTTPNSTSKGSTTTTGSSNTTSSNTQELKCNTQVGAIVKTTKEQWPNYVKACPTLNFYWGSDAGVNNGTPEGSCKSAIQNTISGKGKSACYCYIATNVSATSAVSNGNWMCWVA